jgi:Spy/CpxP family protein refolding chaperone
MDKQISEDYDLHVDVTTDKFDKLELKREITQMEEQIKILELEADEI